MLPAVARYDHIDRDQLPSGLEISVDFNRSRYMACASPVKVSNRNRLRSDKWCSSLALEWQVVPSKSFQDFAFDFLPSTGHVGSCIDPNRRCCNAQLISSSSSAYDTALAVKLVNR